MNIISSYRRIAIYLRKMIKALVIVLIAVLLILVSINLIYKPIYEVSMKGQTLGYVNEKSNVEDKIKEITTTTEQNEAFIEIDGKPEYKKCFSKKGIQTNEEEIYAILEESKTTYYKYYAIADNGEEKAYVSTLEQAEEVIDKLKTKNSKNKDELSIVEKYNTELAKLTEVSDCVKAMYEKKVVKTSYTYASTGTVSYATGKNLASSYVDIGIKLSTPVSGVITSRYGPRSRDNHPGLDIGASKGTPIHAAASGTVSFSGWSGGYGNFVIINHGNGVQTCYGHCSELCVKAGASVSTGDVIAKVGTTGTSTGNHLHFEVRKNGVTQNPENYVY